MALALSARIHPTAVIDPQADIGENTQVGPFVVIDGPVRIGSECIIRAHATLIGPLTLGRGNDVGVGAVLGDRPQHLAFTGKEDTGTEIGDHNIFRESVTIHRGTPATGKTIIGSRNFLMVNSHVGHDSRLGNNVILANGALVAGHCEIFDRAFFSGNSAIHQFARVGKLAFISGNAGASKDLLPFMLLSNRDHVVGVNRVGMQRAGYSPEDINVAKQAYRILYRDRLLQRRAIEKLEADWGGHPVVQEIIQFIQNSKRGFIGGHHGVDGSLESDAA